MKAIFNASAPKSSFFKKEQERIESLIKEPLLELVLKYLPHLQSTQAEQDDTWEIIAINLNSIQYDAAINSPNSDVNDVDEIPTLNGPYIKEVYLKLMNEFTSRVYTINRSNEVYKAECIRSALESRNAAAPYAAYSLPVRDVLTKRTDRLLCELFYLKGYDVEVMATLSKERLQGKQRQLFNQSFALNQPNADHKLSQGSDAITESPGEETHKRLEYMKENSEREKLESIERELTKKNKKLEQLTNENKRLLQLNHELVLELQALRGQK